jgi:hypothetical protein
LLWSRAGNRKNTSKDNADPEAQLVERLKQREESAFLELYDRHRSSVYWFLVHMTGSVAVAEDLTQGVFVAILEKIRSGTIEQFDSGKGAWEGYLLGVAKPIGLLLWRLFSKPLNGNDFSLSFAVRIKCKMPKPCSQPSLT